MNFSLDPILGLSSSINPIQSMTIFYRISIALILSSALLFIYRFYFSKQNKSPENSLIVFISGPIVAMILIGIGSSIPRAFGLFAALSIIRFRTPVKATNEMAFIFLAVALGISVGAGSIRVAVIGFSLITLGVFLFLLFEIKKQKTINMILDIKSSNPNLNLQGKFPFLTMLSQSFEQNTHQYSYHFAGIENDYKKFSSDLSKDTNIIKFQFERVTPINSAY